MNWYVFGGEGMSEHKIIGMIKDSGLLPHIPQEFGEILNMLLEPIEYDIDSCVDRFSRFPQLEKILIKVLNYNFDLSREIRTIKDAINYLGAKNAKVILISYVTRLLLPDAKGRTRIFDNKRYWKHCLGTSIAAYMIAEETGLSDKDKMFTYGLIHDIGVTVLDICLPDYLDRIHEMQLKGMHQIAAEKIVLSGITHAEIGMWICKEWKLPDEMLSVVGYHHYPMVVDRFIDEVRVIHLADSISTNYYERLLGNNSSFIYTDKIMKALNIDKKYVDYIIEKLPIAINDLNKRLVL